MVGKRPWRVEFDEYGGYDCMTSAYRVEDADGNYLFSVDVDEFVTEPGWDASHAENEEARRLAECIVAAINLGEGLWPW